MPTSTPKTPKTTPNLFLKDLQTLRAKYPQCYLEAWMPSDFRGTETDNDEGLDWDSADAVDVAVRLADKFRAEYGTDWNRIAAIVDSL